MFFLLWHSESVLITGAAWNVHWEISLNSLYSQAFEGVVYRASTPVLNTYPVIPSTQRESLFWVFLTVCSGFLVFCKHILMSSENLTKSENSKEIWAWERMFMFLFKKNTKKLWENYTGALYMLLFVFFKPKFELCNGELEVLLPGLRLQVFWGALQQYNIHFISFFTIVGIKCISLWFGSITVWSHTV